MNGRGAKVLSARWGTLRCSMGAMIFNLKTVENSVKMDFGFILVLVFGFYGQTLVLMNTPLPLPIRHFKFLPPPPITTPPHTGLALHRPLVPFCHPVPANGDKP